MTVTAEQAREITRCKQSAAYFVYNYAWMRHLELGAIRFIPWNWQISLLNLWQAGKSTITNKSRQVGASWTAAGYFVWLLNFRPEIDLLLLSEKEEKAKKLLKKLSFIHRHLPAWLKAKTVNDTQTQLAVSIRYYDETRNQWSDGEGQANSLTTTGTSGAGESVKAVLIDEFALMTERGNDKAVWAAIAPTTTHGGQIIILSTPRGAMGEFYRIWEDTKVDLARLGANVPLSDEHIKSYSDWNRQVLEYAGQMEMIPFLAHYSMGHHDEKWIAAATRGLSTRKATIIRKHFTGFKYDEAWRDKVAQKMKLSSDQIAQEFELCFTHMGNQAFNSSDISACYRDPKQYPWVNDMIARSNYYYIGIDVSEGITENNSDPDYNSIIVFNQSGVQVYAYHSRENIDEFAGFTSVDPITHRPSEVKGTVLKVLERFQPCTAILEKNGPGLTVQNRVENHPAMQENPDINLLVLSMTGGIKPQLVSDFRAEMADEQVYVDGQGKLSTVRKFIFTDYFTVMCLRHFLKLGPGKFGPATGAYADPVIGCLWAAYAKRIVGAYDAIAVLPQQGDSTRPIALDREDDLRRDEVPVYGPAVMPMGKKDDYAAIAGGFYDNPERDSLAPRRGGSLGGRDVTLKGRGR